MLLVTLDSDDCVNDGAFVHIGAVAMAMAIAKSPGNIKHAERKMFARVNGAVQCGALHPFDPDTLVPLSKSDYGHGMVAIGELVTWGRSQLPPFDFKPAKGAPLAPDANAAADNSHEPAPASNVVAAIDEPAPKSAESSPRFSMTKAGLINAHEHEWPTIKGDIAAAAGNGLAAAKASARGWYEEVAMEWARAKGKLNTTKEPASHLNNTMTRMASLPSRRHTMGD